MLKNFRKIVLLILMVLFFTCPWLWLDNGEDVMESFFGVRDRPWESFEQPVFYCDEDGAGLSVSWVPFGVIVERCSERYYFVSFWRQKFYIGGDLFR